jgi:cytochrome c6
LSEEKISMADHEIPECGSEKGFTRTGSTGMARTLRVAAWATIGAAALALAGSVAWAHANGAAPAPQGGAGKAVFEANCVACHGEDGAGTSTGQALNAPDLRSDAVQKLSDADLKKQVSDGKNNMPPFKDTLKPDEITAVVAYVRTFAHKK